MATTRELAEDYAANFDDVTLVRVARNGAYAVFEETGDYGSGAVYRKLSRQTLLSIDVIDTPYGPVVTGGTNG